MTIQFHKLWVWFWRYLMRGLIWHLSQYSIRPSIILVWLWNHAWIHSWNQPVLSNKGKVSCSRKQREKNVAVTLLNILIIHLYYQFIGNTCCLKWGNYLIYYWYQSLGKKSRSYGKFMYTWNTKTKWIKTILYRDRTKNWHS